MLIAKKPKKRKNCDWCNSKLETIKIVINDVYDDLTLKCSNKDCGKVANSWLEDKLEVKILDSIGYNITYLCYKIVPYYLDFYRNNELILNNLINRYDKFYFTSEKKSEEVIVKAQKAITYHINNYYLSIMQLVNKFRDLIYSNSKNNQYWNKIMTAKGMTQSRYIEIQTESGLHQVFDKYNIGDTRGGFAHGRDVKRMDSISKITFEHLHNKKGENKVKILLGNNDIEKIINDISQTLLLFINKVAKELLFRFSIEINELNVLRDKQADAQKEFGDSGVILTDKDSSEFKISYKM